MRQTKEAANTTGFGILLSNQVEQVQILLYYKGNYNTASQKNIPTMMWNHSVIFAEEMNVTNYNNECFALTTSN